MNEAFRAVATSVKGISKKAGGLFGLIGTFVLSEQKQDETDAGGWPKGMDIKPIFAREEKAATAEMKVTFGKDAPSTYRVVKALFVNCVAAGIALEENGKLRGKTDLEAELAALKVPKSELDKFKGAVETASKISDNLPAHDRLIAAALVQELLKSVANGLALAA